MLQEDVSILTHLRFVCLKYLRTSDRETCWHCCRILWMNLNMNSSSRQKLQSCSITRGVLVCKTGIYGIRCQNLLVLLFPFFKAIWPLINPEANFIAAFLGTFASLDEINVWLHRFLFHDRYSKCTLRLWHVAVHQKIRQIPEREVDSLQVCFLIYLSPGVIPTLEYQHQSCW